METFEEKTPKGYTLKIYMSKNQYLAFDRKGGIVYSDLAGVKVMHKIPIIAFLGPLFSVRNKTRPDYTLYKVSKGNIVLPYYIAGDKDRRYFLQETEEQIDMIPVRLLFFKGIRQLILQLDTGFRPDAIIVDHAITQNDIIIIKNRFSNANIIITEKSEVAGVSRARKIGMENDDKRAFDMLQDVNLNIMSDNPVFLARLHFREMKLSKVRQLLLDLDLSIIDAEYILAFIEVMLRKADIDEIIKKNQAALEKLGREFQFYIAVMKNDKNQTDRLIEKSERSDEISSFITYLAKAMSIIKDKSTQLALLKIKHNLEMKKNELKKTG